MYEVGICTLEHDTHASCLSMLIPYVFTLIEYTDILLGCYNNPSNVSMFFGHGFACSMINNEVREEE
jgi:hypothetical protein